MNSKETSRLITIFICISYLLVFLQCTSSQPLSRNLLKTNINDNDDSIWMRTLSNLDPDEVDSEENDSEEMSRLLSKILIHNERDQNNQPSFSSPVRRANFWKRANFWRKRANFWRRDLAA